MDVGITSFCLDRTIHPVQMAKAVEERGFESLWYPEHSHIPVSRETPWPGGPNGEPLPEDYWHMHDLFNALSMAGAVTERLRLGTSVCLIGQRDPIWLAKQVASLDHLTGGRVELGIGFSWNREELESHVPWRWERRRDMVREKVLAMRALWADEPTGFEGEFVSVPPSLAFPKPVQRGAQGPPLTIGGGWGPKLLDAICDYADGWAPVSARPSFAARMVPLREACERAGRDPATVQISIFGATTEPAGLANLEAEGIHRACFTIWPQRSDDDVLRLLDQWAAVVAEWRG
jgi:probable F420-dependent oxidoreductase